MLSFEKLFEVQNHDENNSRLDDDEWYSYCKRWAGKQHRYQNSKSIKKFKMWYLTALKPKTGAQVASNENNITM